MDDIWNDTKVGLRDIAHLLIGGAQRLNDAEASGAQTVNLTLLSP